MPQRAARLKLHVVLGGSRCCCPGLERRQGATVGRDSVSDMAGTALAGRVALVVDDEPMIVEILGELCTSLGMKVYEAADGVGALGQFELHPEIEVLVTDVRMPGLDGPGLAERILALRPELKIIFVTGYTTYRSATWPILRKPFDLDDLEKALRRALIQKGPSRE